jgi:tetratricopeptide (TPR) repeat protein
MNFPGRRRYMSSLTEKLLENALFLSQQIDKPAARSVNFIETADIFLQAGLKNRCLDTLSEAIKITESIKQPVERVTRFAWAAGIYARAGETEKSRQLFQRSVLLGRAIAEAEKIQALTDVAAEYLEVEFKEEALPLLADLETLIDDLASEAEKAHQLTVLADIYGEFEQHDKAIHLLEHSLRIASSIKDNWFKAERLEEIAQSYADLAAGEKAFAVMEDLLSIVGRMDAGNRPYFLFNIVDIHLDLGNKAAALALLTSILEIINQDQSTFSQVGSLVEAAERYRDAGTEKKAVNLLSYAREAADKAESDNDKISGYTRIAGLLASLGESATSLELAEKAFYLCGNLKNERTHIYMLGDLAEVYLELRDREKTSRCIARIVEIVRGSDVRTLGLGEVATDLAESGEVVLALKLIKEIREIDVKAAALCSVAGTIVELGLEPSEELEMAARELIDGISSQRGVY